MKFFFEKKIKSDVHSLVWQSVKWRSKKQLLWVFSLVSYYLSIIIIFIPFPSLVWFIGFFLCLCFCCFYFETYIYLYQCLFLNLITYIYVIVMPWWAKF
jgi:hypothetical protein